MKKLLMFLLMFLSASPVYAQDEVVGLWQTEFACALDFKADGTVAYIHYKTKTGYTWKRVAKDKLLMAFSYIPSTEITEKEYKVVVDGDTMYMNNGSEDYVLKRSKKKIRVLQGEIFYRERIQLPPKVDVRYELYKNNEEVPFAMYAFPHEGKIPLPFSFECLAGEQDKIYINAAIYHDNIALFSTPGPVSIENKQILLYKADGKMTERKIPVPSKYMNADGDVFYFEKNGLAVLQKNSEGSVAHWAIVDRNQKLEITQGEKLPLSVIMRDDKTLVVSRYGDKEMVPFRFVENDVFDIGKFTVHGTVAEKKDRLYFNDCITACSFPVQFPRLVYKSLGMTSIEEPYSVKMDVILRRNENNELDLYPVKVAADDTQVCGKMFQNATLENTYWRLIRLNGKSVQTFENQAEPHIIIRDGMMSGSDGCNNFFMPAEIKEQAIKTGPGGSTLMLCPHGEEQAADFKKVLEKADSWQIKGSVLKLLSKESVLALFEAVYL